MATLASLLIALGIDARGLQAGLGEAVKASQSSASQIASTYTTVDKAFEQIVVGAKASAKAFRNDYIAGLERGTATTDDFRSSLLAAAQQADLGTGQINQLAGATGLFSEQELHAGRASASMAAKATELTAAVKSGKMTTDEAGKAFGEFARELEVSAQKSTSLTETLGSALGTITKVSAGVAVVGKTMQEAFELGRAGASVAQTRESFQGLLQTVGSAPNLLEQLRSASRGTVSDMTLMSSSLTLAAGAEKGFARELLNATPDLLEMAKAANKLNPTLGDTAYLYESITTGIKRGSPMILDNLGITVRLEEAYATYAQSLGKTADSLTSTEQKQALLNEVLGKGQILIEQAGGSAAAQTDPFDRLTSSVDNIVGAIKERLMPTLASAAGALDILLTGNQQMGDALQTHRQEIIASTMPYEEYRAELTRAAEAAGYMVDQEGNLVRRRRDGGREFREVIQAQYIYSEATLGAVRAENEQLQVAGAVPPALEKVEEAIIEVSEEYKKMAQGMTGVMLQAGLAGELQRSWDSYKEQTLALKNENAQLYDEIKRLALQGLGPASAEWQRLTGQMDDNVAKQDELRQATNLVTREFVYQKAAANMSDQAALELARAMGILSEDDYQVTKRIMELTLQADKNMSGMVELDEATGDYITQLVMLSGALQPAVSNISDMSGGLNELALQAEFAAEQAYRLQGVQAALEAGLSGRLTASVKNYRQAVVDAVRENHRLDREYWALVESGQATEDQLADLRKQMQDNNKAQVEAQAALHKSTAEIIYQQASAGLGAEESLTLARAMGLVSETDYEVMMSLQALRSQFDKNKDGSIDAAEGAREYTKAVLDLYNAVQKFADKPLKGGLIGDDTYTGGAGQAFGPGASNFQFNYGGANLAGAGQANGQATAVNFYYQPFVTSADQEQAAFALKPVIDYLDRQK